METKRHESLSISLPVSMRKMVDFVGKMEERSTSEVIREALRTYFVAKDLVEDPTPADVKAMKKSEEDIKRGRTYTLAETFDALGLKDY